MEADSLHVLQLSEKTSCILRFYHTLERKHIRGKTISDFIFFFQCQYIFIALAHFNFQLFIVFVFCPVVTGAVLYPFKVRTDHTA